MKKQLKALIFLATMMLMLVMTVVIASAAFTEKTGSVQAAPSDAVFELINADGATVKGWATDLSSAYTNVEAGGTIKMLKDDTRDDTAAVSVTKVFTFDGNNCKLTLPANGQMFNVQSGGDLTMTNCYVESILGVNKWVIAVSTDNSHLTLKGNNTFVFSANKNNTTKHVDAGATTKFLYVNKETSTLTIESTNEGHTTLYQIGHGYGIHLNSCESASIEGLEITNSMEKYREFLEGRGETVGENTTTCTYSGAVWLVSGTATLENCNLESITTSGATVAVDGGEINLVNCTVTGPRAISNANSTGASGGVINVRGGTYQGTNQGAVVVRRGSTSAVFNIYGGNFLGTQVAVRFEGAGGTVNMYGGTFSSTDFIIYMPVKSTLNVDVPFDSDVSYDTDFSFAETTVFLKMISSEAQATVKGGKFLATGTATAFSVTAGTLTVNGGEFITEDTATAFAVTDGTFTVNGGTFRARHSSVTVDIARGKLTVNGGTFNASKMANTLYITNGDTLITNGTFTGYGVYMMDIVLVEGEGSFEIQGGTFTLLGENYSDGAIIRTGVRVTPQHDVNQNYDPTNIYYFSTADIKLSGGLLIDERSTNTQVIDATLGTSRIVISGAVLLSKYQKYYFVDANDTLNADVLFTLDAPVCKYGSETYYYYTATTASEYAPVMEARADVAITPSYDGIRFTSCLPAEVAKKLAGKSYTLGTLIAPADYVAAAGGFTHALLDALSTKVSTTDNKVTTYVDVEAKYSILENADGSISFSGALIKLKETNYARNLAAIAYVLVDGTYYYSEHNSEDHAYSMAYVAKQAYTTVGAQGVERSIYDTSRYSRYTEAEQLKLQHYCNYTHTRTSGTVIPSTNITWGEDASANLIAEAVALQATLSGLGYTTTGTPILVGNTGAAETVEALSEIEGHGYYIGVINEKLVIVGTTNLLTMQALSVFKNVHLNAINAEGKLPLWEEIASNKQMVSLGSDTAFIFSRTRDGNVFDPYSTQGQIVGTHSNNTIYFNASRNHLYNYETNPAAVDYPVAAALEIGTVLNSDGYNYYFVPDDLDDGMYGIYMGVTDKALDTLLKGKDVGYYGYAIKDGNVIISSFDDATLRLAKKMFLDDLADFAVGNGYMIPTDYSFEKGKTNGFTGAFNNYSGDATVQAGADILASELSALFTDFPRPEGLQLTGAVNVGNNSLQLVYENATLADFDLYCAVLKADGYTEYGGVAPRYVEGNAFVTYSKTIGGETYTLHVMYNAYPYAERETLDTGTTLSEMFTPSLRVVAAKVDGTQVRLLPEEFLRIPQYEKVTDSKMTVVQINKFGYCYVYTLEDGRFVVLDGGSTDAEARDNLYRVLTELYKSTHNDAAPTVDAPIEIAAWYLSHPHSDHYGMMGDFISTYCNVKDDRFIITKKYESLVKVDCIISNFVSGDQAYNSQNPGIMVSNRVGTDKWFTCNGKAIPYYKVHTGQRFFISNLEFEVMYTAEDIYPWATLFFNNTSTVMRLISRNTDGTGLITPGSISTSNMVLADLQARGSMVMRATWGDYLKSDMVVCAHHVLNGSEGDLYELIDAQVLLLTNSGSQVEGMFFTGTSYFVTQNKKLLENTHWLYMIAGKPDSGDESVGSDDTEDMEETDDSAGSGTSTTTAFYNVTITMGFGGIAGLEEGEDQTFIDNLTIVAGGTAGSLSFGEGKYTGTEGTYTGNGLIVHRENFDVEMPPYVLDETPAIEDNFDTGILDLETILGITA